MGGARVRKFMDEVFHSGSGGRKPGGHQQPPEIQQPRGDHDQQPNSQQSQSQERNSGKSFSRLRSLSPFTKGSRSAPEAITTSHTRPSSQSDAIVSGTLHAQLVPTSGRIAVVSSSLNPPSRDPVSGGKLQASSASPTQLPPGTTVLGDGDSNHITGAKNGPRTPSSSPELWQKTLEIAQESLTRYKLPLELGSLQSQSAAENIQSLVKELETAHREIKDRQWCYKDRQGNEVVWVERLGKILKSVDKYAAIVDTAIQHHPDITALVWAGTRTILQVALNHVEAMECFEATMVTIMDKMAVSAFYTGIYTGIGIHSPMGDTGKLHEVLGVALPELYAAIIVFTIKARYYFNARWIKKAVNMLKPFAIEFQPCIDDIIGKEKTVQECANMATMERIRGFSGKIAEVENLLINMRADMKPLFQLNEISDALTENVQVSKEILKRSLRAEDDQLLQLLSPLEPLKRHVDVKSIRLENTGTWLLDLECFHKWCDIRSTDTSGRILCCYGMPGSGKTVISSRVIDHLYSQATEQLQTIGKTSVVCLYADYRDWNSQTLVHILGSFLHQFLTSASLPHIPNQVIEKLKEVKKRNLKLQLEDILAMLKFISAQLDGSFLCIDALDELEPQTRRKLLDILSNDLGTKTTRLFFTGRPHIQSEVQKYFEIRQEQEVKIIANPNDIRQYLSHKIAVDRRVNPDAMNEALETEILLALVARSQGMFLLPALHIDTVLDQATVSKRRKALGTLPTELHDTYERAIKRIQQSRGYAELGMKVLLWLHFAYQPLKLEELQHALAVEKDDIKFEVDNTPSRKAIVDCCLGLVSVDEESKTARFVHYSLEEYFRLQSGIYFPYGHSTIAETCLRYLNFPEIREHSKSGVELMTKLHDFPFLKYAACNWGTYANRQSNETLVKLALKLPGDENELPSTPLQIFYAFHQRHGWEFRFSNHAINIDILEPPVSVALLFSGVHLAAFFGLDDLIKYYCNIGQADIRDDTGRTPLSWTVEWREVGDSVARLLVQRNDVDVNGQDNYGRTALSLAAECGHEAIAQLLIERDNVNVSLGDEIGRTPLSWAASAGRGREGIVRLLIERNDVDVDLKDKKYGQTPLSGAASAGAEAIVRLLIERDNVDVNSRDETGTTPLIQAAMAGREAIVRLLIERNDVDVDAKDIHGSSALGFAAAGGFEAIVRLLVERKDVDVEAKDIYGMTLLHSAAMWRREAVVRLLVERNDVDINAKDNDGRTPLSWAAADGQTAPHRQYRDPPPLTHWERSRAVVRLLLEQDNIDLDAKDRRGRTALDWAIAVENILAIELLQAATDRHKQLELRVHELQGGVQNGIRCNVSAKQHPNRVCNSSMENMQLGESLRYFTYRSK